MPRSQPPPESADKGVDNASIDKFKELTKRLLTVHPAILREALEKERQEKRDKSE